MASSETLDFLRQLVACDTQNPPRAITSDHPIVQVVRDGVPGFEITVTDWGDGRVNIYCRRGKPSVLFNVHLDTVPTNAGWTRDPFDLGLADTRAIGLGACDIKGAAACLLDLANTSDEPMALLFSTDEEGTNGCCINRFCQSGLTDEFAQVVVAEPTQCRAVLAHRGYLSIVGQFTGVAGHSSEPRAMEENAIHRFARWAGGALETVARMETETGRRTCFNLGRVAGGIKSNVIADELEVQFSARLEAGIAEDDFCATLCAKEANATWTTRFSAPALPATEKLGEQAMRWVSEAQIKHCEPVDFWTEAALFSRAGRPAIVLGPGNIAQAHAADEWVSLIELEQCREIYRSILVNQLT